LAAKFLEVKALILAAMNVAFFIHEPERLSRTPDTVQDNHVRAGIETNDFEPEIHRVIVDEIFVSQDPGNRSALTLL
jgi:hypothetical protein